MNRRALFAALMLSATGLLAQVSPDQAKRIRDAVPEQARVKPKQLRRVLIFNTPFMETSPHKGYTIPQGEFAFKWLGQKTGAYEPVVSDDVTLFLAENLKQFHAIILNNANGPWIRPTTNTWPRLQRYGANTNAVEQLLRRNFLEWVTNGGGIFAIHYSVGANAHWPEFIGLLGAGYDGHPWNEEVGVKLDEPDHPLVAAFGGKPFRIAEEIYQFKAPYSRDKVRVLLSLDTERTHMAVKWVYRKDDDFGLAWVRPYGHGRVFYCAFGHRTEHWWNPTLLKFYLDGIQFVLRDLDAPAEPVRK